MYNAIQSLLQGNEFSIEELFSVSPQAPRYAEIPAYLSSSRVGGFLKQEYPNGLWAHQSEALNALGNNENLVVSTSTASGKSLIFQAYTFHQLTRDPSSKVVVFYPLRALVSDQLRGWTRMAKALGFEEAEIGRIDGTVPMGERIPILQKARVVAMTPDVCHAWLMSNLPMPAIRTFLRSLTTLIIDEAHTMEGVFGSNSAYLIRRLIAARNHLLEGNVNVNPLQLVTATATIANPSQHLKQLTGMNFTVVDHNADGAPRQERLVAHVASPTGSELQIAKEIQTRLLANGTEGSFITFVDSRKGVETLAIATQGEVDELSEHREVSPYRAGFTPVERRSIEGRLRSGKLRGVVSTSALELGIDLPNLRVGINVGIPSTRKAYRQRLGRVGRAGPGAFIIVAPPDAFRRFGTSFREYHEMSVEDSYLYLDNRFVQFAHGRCLSDEREALGSAPSRVPTRIGWPEGFREIYGYAIPGGNRPTEFDAMARLGGDTPHRGYPLRNIGDINFQIKFNQNSDSLGDVGESQALRECYPGATYFHNSRAYESLAWNARAFDSYIRVKNTSPHRLTRPQVTTWVNTSVTEPDVIQGHFLKGDHGFLLEAHMLVTERVEGFFDAQGRYQSYRELQQSDANMRSRSRNFRTTGVVLCIDQPWFKDSQVKRGISDKLLEVFTHEFSIMSQDLGSAATNISVRSLEGSTGRGTSIAIFDNTYGSLRFTEKLYLGFGEILERLQIAADAEAQALKEMIELPEIVKLIREQYASFVPGTAIGGLLDDSHQGYDQVFAPSSVVCYTQAGKIAVDVQVIEPAIFDGKLMYRVVAEQPQGGTPLRRWVPASACEPSADADAWNYAWWNRETEIYEDPPVD